MTEIEKLKADAMTDYMQILRINAQLQQLEATFNEKLAQINKLENLQNAQKQEV